MVTEQRVECMGARLDYFVEYMGDIVVVTVYRYWLENMGCVLEYMEGEL